MTETGPREAQNIEIVRAALEAWNAGKMDVVLESIHPEAVMGAPEGWPEPGPFLGRDAIARQFGQLRETYDRDAVEVVSDFAAAGDRVAVRLIWRGTGRGPQSNLEWTLVFTIIDGKVRALHVFWDHAEALASLAA